MNQLERLSVPPDLYDRMYADFRADVAFHVAEAEKARGPVLEVCCGNGRLLIPMLHAGADVDGLDRDERMLADLERKLRDAGLSAYVQHADMRDFTMRRRYRLVIIPFNSFYHNLTQDDQLATLRCCREHLEPGGRLSVVVYHPNSSMLASFDGTPQLWKEIPLEDGGRLRVFNAVSVDRVEQVQTNRRTAEVLDRSGARTATHDVGFQLRYAYKPEMELLLRTAGFSRWAVHCPFERWESEAPFETPQPPRDGQPLAWSAWRA